VSPLPTTAIGKAVTTGADVVSEGITTPTLQADRTDPDEVRLSDAVRMKKVVRHTGSHLTGSVGGGPEGTADGASRGSGRVWQVEKIVLLRKDEVAIRDALDNGGVRRKVRQRRGLGRLKLRGALRVKETLAGRAGGEVPSGGATLGIGGNPTGHLGDDGRIRVRVRTAQVFKETLAPGGSRVGLIAEWAADAVGEREGNNHWHRGQAGTTTKTTNKTRKQGRGGKGTKIKRRPTGVEDCPRVE